VGSPCIIEEAFAMAKPHPPNPPTNGSLPLAHGEGVRCPRCGNTGLLRIHRRLLDRLLSCVRPVFRFRCADPHCAWEGTRPQKSFARNWYRQYYRY
jgi:hypothetical protein